MATTLKSSSSTPPVAEAAAESRPNKPDQLPADLVAVLRLLPGYDPFEAAEGCWFDVQEARRVILFFETMLVHIEGDEATKSFRLEPWQQGVVANLFAWKKVDSRGRIIRRYRELFLYVPRKNGKALDVDTPIPVPGGWKRMGDLVAGDFVFDHEGKPTRVNHAFPAMHDRTCYRVVFSDGTSVVADAEHLWETDSWSDRKRLARTTEEVRRTLTVGPDGWNHSIGHRQIVAVEPVESRPVRCIAVDNPRKLYLAGPGMVPTHNTPLCAGIALYVFFCDAEEGQQCFIAAKDKSQAGFLFRQLEGMVEANKKYLGSRCRVYGGNAPEGKSKSLVKKQGSSFLKVISADVKGKHGSNSHLVIIDELHEQDDRALYDTLRTSLTSLNRKQPLFIQLTTADYDRPSICNERYEQACRVRDNPELDPQLLPVIYEALATDDWAAEETWVKANPNLDVSVNREELARMAREGKNNPALLAEFRRLHTNIRVQKLADKAIDLQLWDACKITAPDPAKLLGKPCWAGLDLGWRDDFAALVRLWRLEAEEELLYAKFSFWVPSRGKRNLRDNPFRGYVDAGLLNVTEGDTTDFRAIRAELDATRDQYDLRALWMDPSYARSEATELMENGFSVTEFRQNATTYSIPWKWFAADGLQGRKLLHDGNPVARWMAGNVTIVVNGTDGVMPLKKKSADKIDGITAEMMGLAAYLADPNKSGDTGGFEAW